MVTADPLMVALEVANAAFYRAFKSGDLTAMARIWSMADGVACLHPGRPPLLGRTAVMESWNAILRVGGSPIEFRTTAAVLLGAHGGVVSGIEVLGTNQLAACNVFRWEDDRWRIVLHQAAGIAPPPTRPPGEALH